MNRKRGKRLLAVAIAVAVAVVGLVVRPWAPVRPKNLILISMDTVRPDHLGCYGYTRPTTPRLDAYARTGARFLQCTSSSSWTTPAHLTIFTGLEPATHGCVYYKYTGRLNERYNTMAKIFTRRGFRTAAFTGGIYAGTRFGLDVGFEKFVEAGENFISKIDKVWSWLAVDTQRPFFLFLHGYDAHRPYVPPAQYRTRFSDGYSGDYDVVDFCRSDRSEPSPVDLRYIVSQYDGEIAGIDDVLGDLLDRLKRRGILKDTL
ncbi:MAG: sulfatase-like hydrolase/transferase, partial [Phycisphaerae bacterium]